VVVAAATLFLGRSGLDLTIADLGSGRVFWHRAVQPGERIELHYVHSVERTPVVEVFRAEADGLWFIEMRFVSQGAGLPTQGYAREGDHFVLRGNQKVGGLPVRVSAVAGHYLRIGDDRVDLVRLTGDGAGVLITARRGLPRLRLPVPR
jgi:hypothetical protein